MIPIYSTTVLYDKLYVVLILIQIELQGAWFLDVQ